MYTSQVRMKWLLAVKGAIPVLYLFIFPCSLCKISKYVNKDASSSLCAGDKDARGRMQLSCC